MAIAFSSTTNATFTATSGVNLTPASPPTVNANDILLAQVWYRDTTTTPSTPANYTLLTGPHTLVGSRAWIFGKIATGGEDSLPVDFGAQAVTIVRGARVMAYSGWVAGTITDDVTGFIFEEGTTAAITDVNITTSQTGALAVNYVFIEDDLPAPSFDPTNTGVSGGTWIEDAAEEITSLGSDGTLGMQSAIPTSDPGTIGGGTFTRGAADNWGIIGFEIKPGSASAAASLIYDSSMNSALLVR
jgi:hypothetical protein